MVAVVNGYVCFTTCDAKQAQQGKDPLALTGASQDSKIKNGLSGQPAAILDGALKEFAKALDPSKSSDPSNPAPGQSPPDGSTSSLRVDVLA